MPRPRMHNYNDIAEMYHAGLPLKNIRESHKCTNKTIRDAVTGLGSMSKRNTKINIKDVNELLSKKPMKSSDIASILKRQPKTVRNFLNANDYPYDVIDSRGTKLYKMKEGKK